MFSFSEVDWNSLLQKRQNHFKPLFQALVAVDVASIIAVSRSSCGSFMI